VLRFDGKLRYADSEEIIEFEAGTSSVAAWERYALRHGWATSMETAPIIAFHVIAHHALGVEGGVDAWIETVDGVELKPQTDAAGEPAEVPPTPAVQSPV
jgi:hypothetical protein